MSDSSTTGLQEQQQDQIPANGAGSGHRGCSFAGDLSCPRPIYNNLIMAFATQQFRFPARPKACLIVKKARDGAIAAEVAEIARYLKKQNVRVFCEWSCRTELPELEPLRFDQHQPSDELIRLIDFCISVGGDGTVLHLNSLFQSSDQRPPPVLSFARGTLGFLTPFEMRHFHHLLERVLNAYVEPVFVLSRTRLNCTVLRKTAEGKEERLFCYQPLNESLVYRGPSASLCTVELWLEGEYMTDIVGDGVIIATPTGSTAYSMSAGGPIASPASDVILVTPLCPPALSVRPLVMPASAKLTLRIPEPKDKEKDTPGSEARAASLSTASSPAESPEEESERKHMQHLSRPVVNFDGRGQRALQPGDRVEVSISHVPLPCLLMQKVHVEFFHSITHKLHWSTSAWNLPTSYPSPRYSPRRISASTLTSTSASASGPASTPSPDATALTTTTAAASDQSASTSTTTAAGSGSATAPTTEQSAAGKTTWVSRI